MESDTSPFNDPEILAAMERIGAVHRPGMAAEMMQTLAPLLKAEGVDLEDPDADLDIDRINSVMANATAQYNLTLMSPVGDQRRLTLAVLHQTALDLAEGQHAEALQLLDALDPDGTDQLPSTGHLTGATIGVLDSCFTDADLRPLVQGTRPLKLKGPALRVAGDLLALAEKGRAFDSIDSLMMRHGGKSVMDGAVLAFASALVRTAERAKISLEAAAEQLLSPSGSDPKGTTRIQPPGPGTAFGRHASPEKSLGELVDAFEEWLEFDAVGEPSRRTLAEVDALVSVASVAAREELDIGIPEDIDPLLDIIATFDDDVARQQAFDVLHDYIHFQLQTHMFAEDWEAAHEAISAAGADDQPVPAQLLEAIDLADALPDQARWAAFSQVRMVSAVSDLLAWLGKSRPITASGVLRRADIRTAASMIGVNAEGVAKRPPLEEPVPDKPIDFEAPLPISEVYYAQSAKHVPMLNAWWVALEVSGLIDVGTTRVRPGEQSDLWRASGDGVMATADYLISVFVAETLVSGIENDHYGFEFPIALSAVVHLLQALVPDEFEMDIPPAAAMIGRPRALQKLSFLGHVGLLEHTDEEWRVPAPLQGAVGRGAVIAMQILTGN